MFNCRLRFMNLLVGLFALGTVLTPPAAAQPTSITPLASASGAISQQQRQQIREYASYWAAQLTAPDAESLTQARRKLLEPLRSPGIRLTFRDEYSRAAVPELEGIVEDAERNLAIVNALQVIAAFGTEQAFRALVDRADPNREPRMAARLWAANGFRLALGEEVVEQQRLTPYVRDLANAAERETHWMVLLREFEALKAAGTEPARQRQVDVLRATLDRIEAGGNDANQLMNAVRRALVLLREQYIVLNTNEQRAIGTTLAPQLGRVVSIGQTHWNEAQADDALKDVFHGAIQLAETQLRLIDAQVRSADTPQTTLDTAWKSADRSAYERDAAQWGVILGRSPYSSR